MLPDLTQWSDVRTHENDDARGSRHCDPRVTAAKHDQKVISTRHANLHNCQYLYLRGVAFLYPVVLLYSMGVRVPGAMAVYPKSPNAFDWEGNWYLVFGSVYTSPA